MAAAAARHAATLIGLIGRHALGESDAATTGTECQGESESESMLANFHDPSPSELLGPFRPFADIIRLRAAQRSIPCNSDFHLCLVMVFRHRSFSPFGEQGAWLRALQVLKGNLRAL